MERPPMDTNTPGKSDAPKAPEIEFVTIHESTMQEVLIAAAHLGQIGWRPLSTPAHVKSPTNPRWVVALYRWTNSSKPLIDLPQPELVE